MKKIQAISAFFLVLILVSVSPVFGQTDTPGKQTIVIYQNGYSLVQDIRQFDMARGSNNLQLVGFPETIQFPSLIPKFNGTINDIRFDNRMPGYETMISQLVGKSVRIDHVEGRSVTGILRRYSPGIIIVEQTDGSNVLLQNLHGYHVSSSNIKASDDIFPRVNIQVTPQRQGRQDLELNYLMNGLHWQSEYSFVLAENERTVRISGWNLIQNGLDHHFKDVQIKLIAGQINTASKQQVRPAADMMLRGAVASGYEESAVSYPEAQSFADLQRYDLSGSYEILPYETRKIPLIEASNVNVSKRYRYTSTDRYMEFATGGLVRIIYEMDNTQRNNLGKPLPSGIVKIYKPQNGQLLLIGEDQMRNVATGGKFSVTTGSAFDILVRENPRAQNRISDKIFDQTSEILIRNQKNEDVVVEVERMINANQRITDSGIPFEMVSANRAVFKVTVKKDNEATVTFTVRTER